jgi:CheY-like chemotaxis protein
MEPRSALLLVEDDPNDVLLLKRAFQKVAGTDFHRVKDGQEAIEYLSGAGPFSDRLKHPLPDLVILDLKLPRKSGLEVLEWLRSDPTLRSTSVVIFTSSQEVGDIDRAKSLGVSAYVVKPAGFDALTEAARTLVRLARPAGLS